MGDEFQSHFTKIPFISLLIIPLIYPEPWTLCKVCFTVSKINESLITILSFNNDEWTITPMMALPVQCYELVMQILQIATAGMCAFTAAQVLKHVAGVT